MSHCVKLETLVGGISASPPAPISVTDGMNVLAIVTFAPRYCQVRVVYVRYLASVPLFCVAWPAYW